VDLMALPGEEPSTSISSSSSLSLPFPFPFPLPPFEAALNLFSLLNFSGESDLDLALVLVTKSAGGGGIISRSSLPPPPPPAVVGADFIFKLDPEDDELELEGADVVLIFDGKENLRVDCNYPSVSILQTGQGAYRAET